MNYLIGIDAGTSALKTVLFDETGIIIAQASQSYPMHQPQNGWAQQTPQDWKDAMLQTLQEVVQRAQVPITHIKGIGLAGQMHGLVMLDEHGVVIRDAILWCDQRTQAEVDDMLRIYPKEKWIELCANPPLTGWTAAKLLWVKKHEPDVYAKCRHILLPKDYLQFVLTGIYATDVSDASGMQLLDVENRCWSRVILDALDIDQSLLAKVYESCQVVGTLCSTIAQQIGLSQSVQVVAGAGDNAAAAIATGVVKAKTAFTTIGTSGVVYAHSDNMILDPSGRIHTCCSAVPGAWHVMGVTQAAGLSLEWFKHEFCQDYVEVAKQNDVDLYDVLHEKMQDIPIGSERLLYLPYLMGERTPHMDAECRGTLFGLSAIHTKAHVAHAIMEGVSYSLCDCHEVLKECGLHIAEMMVCGGGAKSELWRDMLTNLFNCEVHTIKQSEGPALGAMILAGVGCGIYPSVQAACNQLLQRDKHSYPQSDKVARYHQFYELYRTLYPSLKTNFHQLATI